MSTVFSPKELQRYSRHFNLSEVGVEGQARLKAARVLCVGAGGLGSPLLLYLAAAGVGTLGIVDHDVVEISNLQRQVLFTTNNIGQNKTIAAANQIRALNPEITVNTYKTQLNVDNIEEIVASYDIIADLTDNFATRFLINDYCASVKKPTVSASIYQFEGQLSVFNTNDGPCYRCLFAHSPDSDAIPNCELGGVLGVLPGVVGTLQATEIIKLILNTGKLLTGRLLIYNALSLTFKEFEIKKDPNCPCCSNLTYPSTIATEGVTPMSKHHLTSITPEELANLKQTAADFFLLDVREPYEYEISNIGGYLIPLSELPSRLDELNKNQPIVVHCKVGGRSKMAAELLVRSGFHNVKNLEGGIDAWIEEIDPSLPRY